MTDDFEALHRDPVYPRPRDTQDPSTHSGPADAQPSRADIFNARLNAARDEIGPLPQGSPCAKCWVADPSQNPFGLGFEGYGLPTGVYEDRLANCVLRYRKAQMGLCRGMVQPPAEVIRHTDQVIEPRPKRLTRLAGVIYPLLQKVGLASEPMPTPARLVTRLVVIHPPAHCGQDKLPHQQY